MRKWLPTLALLVLLAPATALPQSKNTKSGVYEQLNLFGEAFERIRQDAVEPVADGKLIETAIAGMMSSLDPHCTYLTEAEFKAMQASAPTDSGSIGLVITLQSSQVKVVSPQDGSPAAAAGIKPGDTIFAIDKEPVYDLTLSEVEQKLLGPVDNEVTLTLRRADGKPTDITVKRSSAKLTTVTSHLDGEDVGYIRIAGFDDTTQAALTAAIQDLQQKAGKKLIGFILDLRNDPGGDLTTAEAVADDFIDKGDIAIIRSRKGDTSKHIPATPGDLAHALPIVALVNGGTAREAELVAGALQDNHRAILLGTKTFGESAIETIIPLDGNGAIRLTTARYETPGGHAIQGKGLTPDLNVVPIKLERVASGFGRREADLRGALKNTDPTAAPTNPAPPASPSEPNPAPPGQATTPPPSKEASTSVASADLGTPDDEQLTQALDVLRGLALVAARNNQ
ncbi:MAG TPA: S41 family peptidase [Stellaceae bacterium]|nr:S41 family peptidase [Stellaceae bacterium]